MTQQKSVTKPSRNSYQKQKWIYPNIFPANHPKAIYKSKSSLLDPFDPSSELNTSKIKGFYNLAIIFTVAFLVTKPLSKFLSEGRFFDSYLFDTFMEGYFFCLMIWPLFFIWSFTSFLLQKMILWGLKPAPALVLQHLTQAGLFFFSPYIILRQNWCSSHAAFVIMQCCVHFMKMHSYTTVNRDRREQYLQCLKTGKNHSSNYPNNITLQDFVLFMITPWLVYDNYPRRQRINWKYALIKASNVVILVVICYIIHTEYIMPYIMLGDQISFLQLVLREMLPSALLNIIMFILIFECLNNFFAQISKLDYREFYEDWWNSTTFEQFNRKWNKPVHNFLYRHVYLQMIIRYKKQKVIAQAVTFTFSAVLHQFLLAVIFRIIYPVFLAFIVFQIPLIYATKFMVGRKSGNYFFWFGIILGPALIVSIYLKIDKNVTEMFTDPQTHNMTFAN